MILIGNLMHVIYDEIFIVKIRKLKDDIKSSVERLVDGYMARKRNESSLLKKFEMAINEIYDPTR